MRALSARSVRGEIGKVECALSGGLGEERGGEALRTVAAEEVLEGVELEGGGLAWREEGLLHF